MSLLHSLNPINRGVALSYNAYLQNKFCSCTTVYSINNVFYIKFTHQNPYTENAQNHLPKSAFSR